MSTGIISYKGKTPLYSSDVVNDTYNDSTELPVSASLVNDLRRYVSNTRTDHIKEIDFTDDDETYFYPVNVGSDYHFDSEYIQEVTTEIYADGYEHGFCFKFVCIPGIDPTQPYEYSNYYQSYYIKEYGKNYIADLVHYDGCTYVWLRGGTKYWVTINCSDNVEPSDGVDSSINHPITAVTDSFKEFASKSIYSDSKYVIF